MNKSIKISTQEAHELFEHGHDDSFRRISERLGFTIVGETWQTCGACREAKAKNEPLLKVTDRNPAHILMN